LEFPILLSHDGAVALIDQTYLSHKVVWLTIRNYRDLSDAICTMKNRDAPTIPRTGAQKFGLSQWKNLTGKS